MKNLSILFLKEFVVVADTTSAGRLFHMLTTLFEKKYWNCLVLNLGLLSLNLWALVLEWANVNKGEVVAGS